MRWNYTKTIFILALAATALRTAIPLLFGRDPFGPSAVGGGPFAGFIMIVLLGPIFAAVDIIAHFRQKRRARSPRASVSR